MKRKLESNGQGLGQETKAPKNRLTESRGKKAAKDSPASQLKELQEKYYALHIENDANLVEERCGQTGTIQDAKPR